MELQPIINAFDIESNIINTDTINSGYINTTYRITTTVGCYILQKININIFKNVDELTQNIIRVTEHIASKTPPEKQDQVIKVIYTNTGKGYYIDDNAQYWRMFNYIPGSKTFDILTNEEEALSMGITFSQFHEKLIDLPEPKLFETLPDFHNTSVRITQFKEAVKNNKSERLNNVKTLVDNLLELAPEMSTIIDLGEKKEIPLRTVHQDTKLNNILFDDNDNAICVIDLDTTMPGYLAYDFGDAVRSGMNTACENEKDTNKVSLNLPLFKSFAKGFASVSKKFITLKEIETLTLGAKVITYEQAIRFLTDYLDGDLYYKVEYAEQNLIRTNVQVALLKDIETNFNEMNTFVLSLYSN